ncbi:MAG: Cof-type HAD-IIB family hydrolase [Patescibacteria group bacterium]
MFLPKAFLLDVDRTITNLNREVSSETQVALAKIQSKIPVGLSTGRSYAQLKNLVMQYMKPGSLHIVSGGGEIVTTEGNVVWSKPIPHSVVKKIIDASSKIGEIYGFGKGETFYGSKGFFDNYGRKTNWRVDYQPVASIDDWSVPLLVVINVDEVFLKFLDGIKEITYKKMTTYQNQPYVDITSVGVNKSVAVEFWSEQVGVNVEQIAMVGDGENDIEILQTVGYGVAMGNAVPTMKEVADLVIGHTDENGLAKYISDIYNILD